MPKLSLGYLQLHRTTLKCGGSKQQCLNFLNFGGCLCASCLRFLMQSSQRSTGLVHGIVTWWGGDAGSWLRNEPGPSPEHLSFICATIIEQSAHSSSKATGFRVRRPSQQPTAGAEPSQSSHWVLWCRRIPVWLLDAEDFPCLLILLQMSAELRRTHLQLFHLHFRTTYPLTDWGRGTEPASLHQGNSEVNGMELDKHGPSSMANNSLLLCEVHPLKCMDRSTFTNSNSVTYYFCGLGLVIFQVSHL